MTNRLPKISDKHKICIICEGNEEYKYLERLDVKKYFQERNLMMLYTTNI